MSRYDILLNDPKKPAPPKEERQPTASPAPTTRPPGEPAKRPGDEPTSTPDNGQTRSRREFIRRGFEWYADQLRALKKLSLEEQMEGKSGNMSQMVREALDDYLEKRAAEK